MSLEAKRPQTFGKAEANIRHAAKQLAARSLDPSALRIIAVCIGKMGTGGIRMLRAGTMEEMRALLRKEADVFFAATRRHWETKVHVDGLLVRISVAGVIDDEHRQYHAAPMTLYTRPGLVVDKVEILRSFVSLLDFSLPGRS